MNKLSLKLFDLKISPSDFENVKKLKKKDYINYKHQRTDDLVTITVRNYGYVLVALVSQSIFPFLGDLRAIIYFQIIIHLILCLFIVNFILLTNFKRFAFILFYAANPLIIHFTTFPFYYFWTFIPSFFMAVLIVKEKWRNWWIFFAIPIMLFSLLIRPTTLFLTLLFFVIAFFFSKSNKFRVSTIFAFILFIIGVNWLSMVQKKSLPWHTIYVGLGAYSNQSGIEKLADSEGYRYFYEKTDIKINTNAINGNWRDPKIKQKYFEVLKNRYFEIVAQSPLKILKNAFANTLQVFSIGYVVERPLLTWINTLVGFLMLVFFVYTRQFIWILAILASAGTFCLYFPPIPAYNFAAYLLLVFACLSGLDWISYRYQNKLPNFMNKYLN